MIAPAPEAAAQWDLLLGGWPEANLLQSHGWGEVQAHAGWSTTRVLVETPRGPLPVSVQVAPSGAPGFTRVYVPRGPVCAASDLESFSAVGEELVRLGRERRALALEVEVPWEEGGIPAGHPWLSWARSPARQPLATVLVDLSQEPEELVRSFSAKTRYNVRLAERRGVAVDETAPLQDLVVCLRATESRHGIHLPSPGHLAEVLGRLGDHARVLSARVEGELVAAVLIADFAGTATYLYGGATGAHRERMPNHLLHWRAMLAARAAGCRRYDLWGVPETEDPGHPWRGLAQFKRGFGGERIIYSGSRVLPLRPGGAAVLALVDSARRWVRRRGRG